MIEDKNRSRLFILNDLRLIEESSHPNEHFCVGLINDNLYHWEVIIFGAKGTPFESGVFRAEMRFPITYPEEPPTFQFITKMWHPNIDIHGRVCISILHQPGKDDYNYEDISERWMPVRSVESVIISILSLLDQPNPDSPANSDASIQFRKDIEGYNRRIKYLAQRSVE